MLRDLLKDADVHTMGMLLESGASGSLHMTFSHDEIRRAIQQPLPTSGSMQGAFSLLSPLSDQMSSLPSVGCLLHAVPTTGMHMAHAVHLQMMWQCSMLSTWITPYSSQCSCSRL